MRNFLVTALTFLLATLPLTVFFVAFYYLESLLNVLGLSISASYFVVGFFIGLKWKWIWGEYKYFWSRIWDTAGDWY